MTLAATPRRRAGHLPGPPLRRVAAWTLLAAYVAAHASMIPVARGGRGARGAAACPGGACTCGHHAPAEGAGSAATLPVPATLPAPPAGAGSCCASKKPAPSPAAASRPDASRPACGSSACGCGSKCPGAALCGCATRHAPVEAVVRLRRAPCGYGRLAVDGVPAPLILRLPALLEAEAPRPPGGATGHLRPRHATLPDQSGPRPLVPPPWAAISPTA